MVTCKVDTQALAIPKMNSMRTRKPTSSHSSGFRLLDSDNQETSSSVSRNSIYKLKIDLMFDDTRSIRSNRLDDPRGSHRTRSIIMYGRSELASTAGESSRSLSNFLHESNKTAKILAESTKKDVQRISNSVQQQIEQLFTDVAKDATSSFSVTCLGSLPLNDKVTSLQGLQKPLRELYLNQEENERRYSGFLDICASGLRIKINANAHNNINANDGSITPFHNIAVWSAVKFVVSDEDGGAAFLPLITDPDNIDKGALFHPLTDNEQQHAASTHAPIFAVVMRSSGVSKMLECHGFICKSTEDAIVIAATLYQSLMAHVSSNSHRSTKRRTPRNQNGVSCVSIASSSAITSSNYLTRSQIVSPGARKSSFRNSSGSLLGAQTPSRSGRKKRISNSSLSSTSNVIDEAAETTTEERKRRSHKTKRAPPIPSIPPSLAISNRDSFKGKKDCCNTSHNHIVRKLSSRGHQQNKNSSSCGSFKRSDLANGGGAAADVVAAAGSGGNGIRSDMTGDILTRVAIPRSGSFLNTGGLTRYKSRAQRRHSGNIGGGGGSPLGFSELFNEFRLHENLHSLDDILSAIIDADGMSFNDLKPIYKEFLLKLAVTLTKDELFQRSKNIMRRQKKKKLKKNTSSNGSQKKSKTLIFGKKSLKKVFQLGQFRSCRGKPPKPPRNKEYEIQRKSEPILSKGSSSGLERHHQQQQRSRNATSGSDVSVVRNDSAFQGLNRNSSSGYVSCSECSYDSAECTCNSVDRCYCSIGSANVNNKSRKKNQRNTAVSKKKNEIVYNSKNNKNRHSLISCKSEDKCYCSMVEEEGQNFAEDESLNTQSDTTWCDTDSCISTSKCYCKRADRHLRVADSDNKYSKECHSRSTHCKAPEKLALDYELFTINGNGKSVQPDEALSVKKSVEAAAIFADVKLSQTTDIKSLCSPPTLVNKQNANGSCRSYASSNKFSYRNRESLSTDRINERNLLTHHSFSSNSSQMSYSADDLLNKLNAIEKTVAQAASIRSSSSKNRAILINNGIKDCYQSMRAVSASLEDTLGYLP